MQVRTAPAPLQEATLTSELPDSVFRDLQMFEASSPTGSLVQLRVLGTGRVVTSDSQHGSTVVILTAAGTITLDGKLLFFRDEVCACTLPWWNCVDCVDCVDCGVALGLQYASLVWCITDVDVLLVPPRWARSSPKLASS